jgi:LysR family transcriptional regulator, hypochlorite-specific transcription factor HypT
MESLMGDEPFGNLQVEWLEAFVAVVDYKKRTAAAERIGRDQGTITKFIQKLELWYRQPLIESGSAPARPTPAGQEFVKVARRVVEDLRAARPAPIAQDAPQVPVSGADIRVD